MLTESDADELTEAELDGDGNALSDLTTLFVNTADDDNPGESE